jgi:signal transduction histidine kinase
MDGLVRGELQVGFSDRQGRIWFGGPLGASQLVPEPDRTRPPPPVLITGVRIAGALYRMAAVGQKEVSGVELQPGQSQLHVEFAGLGLGDDLRYQFKLEGAETDWSAPTGQRSVEYAQLSPGRYRFLVRALTDDGAQSPQTAAVIFLVMAPVWRRWWFLTLAALAGGLLISALYRYRVAHLLELERMRTRIATDLHDDIGSSLSQIAILSEVVRRRITEQDPTIQQRLSHIAQTSRELVDALGEIVWAMQPSRDRLDELTTRMRHFASNIFTAREIDFEFRVLAPDSNLKLDAAARRQVFLIFKEAVNNIVRHANCSRVGIDFAAERDLLIVTVSDNGIGITPGSTGEGHGLANMRRRAEALGGTVAVLSSGQAGPSSRQRGVVVTLTIPLAGSRKTLWRRFLHT